MSYLRAVFILLLGILILDACEPPAPKQKVDESTDLTKKTRSNSFREVHRWADQMNRDSLRWGATSDKDLTRLLSIQSLQSLGQARDLPLLETALGDSREEVRVAAAYAIGQIEDPMGAGILLQAYTASDSLRIHSQLNAAILEAMGKCGEPEYLPLIATMKGLAVQDTALLLGQARGILRYALRGITDPQAIERSVVLATGPQYPTSVRIVAAHVLARIQEDLSPYSDQILPTAVNHPDPELRIPLVLAFAKINNRDVPVIAEKIINEEKDYRVLTSLIQGWTKSNPRYARDLSLPLLNHSNPHVQRSILNYFLQHGNAQNALATYEIFKSQKDPQIKYLAAAVTNKNISWRNALQKEQINSALKNDLKKSDNPYHIKWILKALSYDVQNRSLLEGYYKSDLNPAVKSAVVSALNQLYTSDKFKGYYGREYTRELAKTRTFARQVIQDKDPGALVELSYLLENEDLQILDDKLRKDIQGILPELNLPRDLETYQALKRLEDPTWTYTPAQNTESLRSIDWSYLRDTVNIKIETSRGNIAVQLYPLKSPASVANFLDLMESKFFDGKSFHRVVPNFVIQDGCPRGDGYGSLNFTLRSQLGRQYYDKAGVLGMASAGKHTEGTQWFITHRATPHLDGRYTIFGQVTDGMAVVHAMTEGDKIISINKIQ